MYFKEIEKAYKARGEKFIISESQKEELRCPDNPLFEMQNLRLLLKPFPVDYVIKAFSDYINGVQSPEAKKYKNDYENKYKLSYVFVLRSIYRVESKLYYGVHDFAYLSSGIAGVFIELCRSTFQYAYFSDREELLNGRISPEIQTKAARDVGKSELDQTKRIFKYGDMVYELANNLGNEFSKYHVDKRMRYPETNQVVVSSGAFNSESIEKNAFEAAVEWSVLQKKRDLQQASIGKKDKEIYVLNRVFAPVFNYSVRTRGGFNIQMNEAQVINFMKRTVINESDDDKDQILDNRISIFDYLDDMNE